MTGKRIDAWPRRVSVLGATGSVGRSTLALLDEAEPGRFEVEALTANRNVAGLAEAAIRLRARFAAVADPACGPALREALSGTGIDSGAGPMAIDEAAARDSDWVIAAIVGAVGLSSTLVAARRGAMVALACKEALVCAGSLLTDAVEQAGAVLLPVDSEHNAIFQVLQTRDPEQLEKLILTSSGGPFRNTPREAMARVTPEQAVAHPVWKMGAKISVDSATMMNKGLEIIEAARLFDQPEDRIEVLIHPEAIIHSLVAYRDGSVLAQLGPPDMRVPIAHALAWPRRMPTAVPRLDLAQIGKLTFHPPDPERFPALRLAREALRAGGTAPAILNAANEVAVELFLAGRLDFLGIAELVERTMASVLPGRPSTLDDVIGADLASRAAARNLAAKVAERVRATA